jgi:hypothetical protein
MTMMTSCAPRDQNLNSASGRQVLLRKRIAIIRFTRFVSVCAADTKQTRTVLTRWTGAHFIFTDD